MSKRLFVGFPISSSDALNAAVKKLRIGTDKREMEFDWSPVENYHVTLNFLGAVEDAQVSEVAHMVSSVARAHSAFKTTLRGLGGFPDEHHMRVLWVGIRRSRLMSDLQGELSEALEALGFSPDEREFNPHLTIARTRKSRTGKDLISPWVRTDFGDVEVGSICLYESVLHGPRPHYEILETFALEAPPSVEEVV
jgi:2'-5' RNA ligase